jgi:hypothetical protein
MKNIIRLTESDLHRIIKESVRRLVNESGQITYKGKKFGYKGELNASKRKKYLDWRKSVDNDKKRTDESINEDVNEDGTMTHKGQIFQYKGDFDAKQRKAWLAWRKQIDDAEARARGEEVPEPEKPKRTRKTKSVDDGLGEEQASPKALALNVKNLIYDKALKSIFVFFTHGEVSYGPKIMQRIVLIYQKVAKKNLFVAYNSLYRNIEKTIEEIESWGRKNEHAVYERAMKLSYYLRDLGEVLSEFNSATKELSDNGTLASLGNVPALTSRGNGRELGLLNLVFVKQSNLRKTLQKLYSTADSLEEISKNGRNPFDYDPNNLRRRG